MKKLYSVISVALILAISLIATSCVKSKNTSNKNFQEVKVEDAIPDFELTMNNGEKISTKNIKGNINLILFFNTKCGDCRKELPIVQEVYEQFKNDKTINFILVSRSESVADVQDFWQKNQLSLPYSAQATNEIYNKFAFSVIPRVYITDKNNVVKYMHTDNPIAKAKELIEEINSLK